MRRRGRQVELAKTLRVGDRADCDDLPARDRETHDRKRPPTWSHDDSRASVHERRSYERREPRKGERLAGHGGRTANHHRGRRTQDTAVGSQHDIGVEHRDKRVEVTVAGGGEEGVDHFSLAGPLTGWAEELRTRLTSTALSLSPGQEV